MLDVKRLKVLREVARSGSFSAAADELGYTQPAVSQQISALEREAGTRLLQRGARGVTLTDAGRALVDHSDAILARRAAAARVLPNGGRHPRAARDRHVLQAPPPGGAVADGGRAGGRAADAAHR